MAELISVENAIREWRGHALKGTRAPLVTMTHRALPISFIGELIQTDIDIESMSWDPDNGVYELMLYPVNLNANMDLGRYSWEISEIHCKE